MRVLLEFGYFCLLYFEFTVDLLLEFGSYLRAGLFRGFTIYTVPAPLNGALDQWPPP